MVKDQAQRLRKAFGAYPTGVTVVTARTRDGVPVGFTANSFTSVSIDPPLLLVCPGRQLSCFKVFQTCNHFAVNVLASDQREVAQTFASYKGDRFAAIGWRAGGFNVPLLVGTAASFTCTVHDRYPAGDHIILLGRVEEWSQSATTGLAFAGGSFAGIQTAA